MRIVYSYQGKESSKDFAISEVVIGRPRDGVAPDLDLSPDWTVSRTHARVWIETGQLYIEDLNSARGTRVNGELAEPRRLVCPGDRILIGDTTLTVELSTAEFAANAQPEDPDEARFDPTDRRPIEQVTLVMDARAPAFAAPDATATDTDRRLNLFYDLPLEFAAQTQLDGLLQLIVERVVQAIPEATRGALLVRSRESGKLEKLMLKAHIPVGRPAASTRLAQEAIERKKAFIWPPPQDPQAVGLLSDSMTKSLIASSTKSAMYAPLLWKNEALGVLCVDNCEAYGVFTRDDLRLLQAVAHHAAMAMASLQLQEELRGKAAVLENLLKLVSPQIARLLKDQRGRLPRGGEFRIATILFSDIRGFTNMSAKMSPHEVTEMLEDYFDRLVPIIFKHQGTIDKFVGDAIMAIFGSPDADEQHHLHAVQAALEMQQAMQEVNALRQARNKPSGELGIGAHCGEVVHGLIGTAERLEFTAIGDTVNRASRYCDGAPGGAVLISPQLYQWVWDQVEVEATSIETKHEGVLSAYRILHAKQKTLTL
jgi:adenylate cyclase